MEKFIYETRPYFFLIFAIWAYKASNNSAPGLFWATILSMVSLYVIYKRVDYRREKGKIYTR